MKVHTHTSRREDSCSGCREKIPARSKAIELRDDFNGKLIGTYCEECSLIGGFIEEEPVTVESLK